MNKIEPGESSSGGTPHDLHAQNALKRRRITRACDRCHKGGIKCSQSNDPSICAPCASFGSECTYERPTKRRGPPAKKGREDGDTGSADEVAVPRRRREERREVIEREDEWRAGHVASSEVIESLVEGYYRIVYPMYVVQAEREARS